MLNRMAYRGLSWLMAVAFGLILLSCLPTLLEANWWLLAVPLLLAAALLLWHGLKRLPPRACTAVFFVLLAFWFVLLLFVGRALRLEHTWDFGRVYEGALDLAQNGHFTWAQNYYWESPNNLPLTLVLALWFRVVGLLGVHPMTAGIALNAVALASSVGLLFCAVRRLYGPAKALYCCIFCFFFSPMVLYVPIFYTDTLSMPFVCLLLPSAAMAQTAKTARGRILWGMAAGLAAGIGYLIKATVLIVAVALVIAALLRYKKRALAFCGVLVLTAATVMGCYRLWFSRTGLLDVDKVEAHRLPASHYVMMGLAGDGGYNEDDHFFSAAFGSVAERQAANRQAIGERLAAYGPPGLAQHAQRKLAYTWADGAYFAPAKLAQYPVKDTWLHEWVLPTGLYYPIYYGLAQAAQTLLLLLLFGGALWQALQSKPTVNIAWTSRLSVFGLSLFLLVWETRSRYLVNFAPLLALCAAFCLLALHSRPIHTAPWCRDANCAERKC